ncbi:hypothetical protein [Pseudoduganella chitinolytica]|uniref:Uncharacterized protein n=1 Tax=Pseudoduganella chitinolytica TaxID=34070 RepID=A0ABY8BF82_9BURK|nr:hypothetical protein [Pseudoduganella chitinolytica]WEF32949.1 hypothetical protein PX653_26740 [Pseudoduganella chitinolytica]
MAWGAVGEVLFRVGQPFQQLRQACQVGEASAARDDAHGGVAATRFQQGPQAGQLVAAAQVHEVGGGPGGQRGA